MITTTRETSLESIHHDSPADETWRPWPVFWSGIWAGALTGFAIALLVGLVATALGAHLLQPEHRIVDLKKIAIIAAVLGVFGAFLSSVAGGWVAGKIAGIRRSEPAMLHGALAWLVSLPLFVGAATLGAGGYAGSWYGGLKPATAAAPFEKPDLLPPTAPRQQQIENDAAWQTYRHNVAEWNEGTPRATRNAALFAVTALLLGLMGGVIGGWMASGETMNFSRRHHTNVRSEAYGL